jgi:hypothetical protein
MFRNWKIRIVLKVETNFQSKTIMFAEMKRIALGSMDLNMASLNISHSEETPNSVTA